jgi:hypothetical protein
MLFRTRPPRRKSSALALGLLEGFEGQAEHPIDVGAKQLRRASYGAHELCGIHVSEPALLCRHHELGGNPDTVRERTWVEPRLGTCLTECRPKRKGGRRPRSFGAVTIGADASSRAHDGLQTGA